MPLSILEDCLHLGFRESGKYRCFFAKAKLDELGNRGGVRANSFATPRRRRLCGRVPLRVMRWLK